MPSGLVLYWTTSQVLMIAQLLLRKKKEVRKT
jgi:membrane protein insertase Oxa1/YidC/SpoIIIJ